MNQTNKTLLFSTLSLIFALVVGGVLTSQLSIQAYFPLFTFVCLLVWSLLSIWILSKLIQKRAKYFLAAILVISLLLTIFTTWFSFVGFLLAYYGVVAFVLTIVVFLIQRIFKRYKSPKWLLLGSTLILSGTLSVLVGGIFATPTPLFGNDREATLKHLFETDQEDRFSGYWIVNPRRDQQRLDYVLETVGRENSLTPEDMYFAAFILQHGTCEDHFRVANELANIAAESNVEGAEWLAQATFDRWQLALGNRQRYGTQQMPIPIKKPCD